MNDLTYKIIEQDFEKHIKEMEEEINRIECAIRYIRIQEERTLKIIRFKDKKLVNNEE